MLTGILFISICVGCYRLSAFGVDAFTCMNLGISGFLGMSFGTWQLIMLHTDCSLFNGQEMHRRRDNR